MDIIISNANNQPIYEQIFDQIKSQIIAGTLKEGDMLPSIRALAKDLRISVITTKRAYDELEQEGYVYTVAGKGCYVAEKNTELIKEEHYKKIEDHIKEIIRLMPSCELQMKDILSMFELLQNEP